MSRIPGYSASAVTPGTPTVPSGGGDPSGNGGDSSGAGGVYLTPAQFKVDLQQLGAAIRTVGSISQEINSDMQQIGNEFNRVSSLWQSPSARYLTETTDWFKTEQTALSDLLEEVVNRLKCAHDNYYATEVANTGNMT
ncbi:WXG100 family type VII secretion target [Streptomyces sp.]